MGLSCVSVGFLYDLLVLQLLPDSAPSSVAYMLELLATRHCVGCQFHRAESRGTHWDTEGNHIENVRPFWHLRNALFEFPHHYRRHKNAVHLIGSRRIRPSICFNSRIAWNTQYHVQRNSIRGLFNHKERVGSVGWFRPGVLHQLG